jgi:hypothetical protein
MEIADLLVRKTISVQRQKALGPVCEVVPSVRSDSSKEALSGFLVRFG